MKTLLTGLVAAGMITMGTWAAQAADTTLRISLQLPMRSHLGQNLKLFEEEVETSSNGAIEVQIYDSAQI